MIEFRVQDQVLIRKRYPTIFSGDENLDKVHFEFDSSWDGYTKTAVFEAGDVYHKLLDDAGECFIPNEVLKDAGSFRIGVFGISGNVVKTSQIYRCDIGAGARTTSTAVPDPTPDIYAQIIALIDAGKVKGDPGEAGVGVRSFTHTGVETPSISYSEQVNDIYRLEYTDDTYSEIKIPRGCRIFASTTKKELYEDPVEELTVAKKGDYLLSVVTGNLWCKESDENNEWQGKMCIKGAAGADGSPGAKGDKGDPGEPGTDAEVTLAKIFELYDGAVAQRALQITDAVPLKQRSGSVMGKVTLQVLRSFILDSVKAIYNDEGYSAALPDEMGADGVLALASDIPDVAGKQDKATLETDVAAAGFTKNRGTYSKPSGGIPKSDLAQAVQSSLGKADSALQSVPNTYALKTDIPSVPTNVSAFTNDAGYLTLETLPKYDGGVE